MKNYLKAFLPSLATTVALTALPIVLTIYFVVTQYSDRFITEQDISYFDVQNNWLGQLFLDQKWVGWFNRFMDFAFWGIGALLVLIVIWIISSAKISFKNHYAQEGFTNFKTNKNTWHGHFFVVLLLKFSLLILIVYSVLAIVGKQLPQLSTKISFALQNVSRETVYPIVLTALIVFGYQFIVAISIKVFKHLQAE